MKISVGHTAVGCDRGVCHTPQGHPAQAARPPLRLGPLRRQRLHADAHSAAAIPPPQRMQLGPLVILQLERVVTAPSGPWPKCPCCTPGVLPPAAVARTCVGGHPGPWPKCLRCAPVVLPLPERVRGRLPGSVAKVPRLCSRCAPVVLSRAPLARTCERPTPRARCQRATVVPHVLAPSNLSN